MQAGMLDRMLRLGRCMHAEHLELMQQVHVTRCCIHMVLPWCCFGCASRTCTAGADTVLLHCYRYNLLREDSEGYAKLLVALNQFGDAALNEELVQPLYKEIQVGCHHGLHVLAFGCGAWAWTGSRNDVLFVIRHKMASGPGPRGVLGGCVQPLKA